MTDEGGGSSGAQQVFGSLTVGELVLAGGALWIFFVVYVIGNRLADDYGNSSVMVPSAMVSLGILAAIYFNSRGGDGEWRKLYPWIVVVGAWGVVVLLALDLLDGIVNDFSSSGEFYEITAYLAAIAMAIGAWMIGQREDA